MTGNNYRRRGGKNRRETTKKKNEPRKSDNPILRTKRFKGNSRDKPKTESKDEEVNWESDRELEERE